MVPPNPNELRPRRTSLRARDRMKILLVRSAALAALATALPAAGEQPPPVGDVPIPSLPSLLRRQWRVESTEPAAESPQWVRTEDRTVERLSLREAVAAALENNFGIAVERLGPTYAQAEVGRANGVFDPVLTVYGTTDRTVTPASSILAGALTVRQKDELFGASIAKRLRTGASFSVAYDSTETDTNSRFVGLRPQYTPRLTFSVTQPLLRNFGLDLTILLVRSAEAGSSVAYYDYQAKVAALVHTVVEAYWGIVQAAENLKAERDGLRLAETLEKEDEARVHAGVLAPIAIKEAQAEAASREERVISAENALDLAAERLRLLVQRNPEGTFLGRRIEPADSPEVRELAANVEDALANAVAGRPEVLRARYDVENRKILAKVKRNNLLPGLDLTASYGESGLAGRGVPQTDFTSGRTAVTPFTGDYGRALDRLSTGAFNSYSAGLRLTVPLGNATAEAEYAQGEIDVRRAELSYRQILADVTLQVRQAVGDVRSNSKRITASRLARELAEENLDQQHKRYAVGLATTKDILDFQQKVTSARAAEIRALIDYNVSLATLRQAEGTLLRQFGVMIRELPPPPTPLWARF